MLTLVKDDIPHSELPETYRGYQMIRLQLEDQMVLFINSYIPPTGCKGHLRYIQLEQYLDLMDETGFEYIVVGDHNNECAFNYQSNLSTRHIEFLPSINQQSDQYIDNIVTTGDIQQYITVPTLSDHVYKIAVTQYPIQKINKEFFPKNELKKIARENSNY